MQDFLLHSVSNSRNISNRIEEMKTMKIWRNIFMMLAAFSLASCSSDDDNDKDIGRTGRDVRPLR